MDAATAEYQVRCRCQRQSALKKETLLSSSVKPNVERCTLTHTCMQRAGRARTASKNDQGFRESDYARVQWEHNDLNREWLCVINDTLRILPWQTPKCGVAYSSSYVLLVILIPLCVGGGGGGGQCWQKLFSNCHWRDTFVDMPQGSSCAAVTLQRVNTHPG